MNIERETEIESSKTPICLQLSALVTRGPGGGRGGGGGDLTCSWTGWSRLTAAGACRTSPSPPQSRPGTASTWSSPSQFTAPFACYLRARITSLDRWDW